MAVPTDLPELEHIYTLWDALADFDAAQIIEARRYLLSTICQMIGASNADWICAVRLSEARGQDPMFGWRPRSAFLLKECSHAAEAIREAFAEMEDGAPDVTTVRNAERAGAFRAFLLSELATPEWYAGPSYKRFYRAIDRRDSIWVGIPVTADAEIQVGFHRSFSQEPFRDEDRQIAAHALRGIRWFYRQQMLGEGVGMASEALTPTERQVLTGLLQGLTERQIADANGQSPHTTHDHVKRIFRKYGVSSRSALMALWLCRPIPS